MTTKRIPVIAIADNRLYFGYTHFSSFSILTDNALDTKSVYLKDVRTCMIINNDPFRPTPVDPYTWATALAGEGPQSVASLRCWVVGVDKFVVSPKAKTALIPNPTLIYEVSPDAVKHWEADSQPPTAELPTMTTDNFDQDIRILINRIVTCFTATYDGARSDVLSPQDKELLTTLLNRYTELKDAPTTPFPDTSQILNLIQEQADLTKLQSANSIEHLQRRAHANSVNKGFWSQPQPPNIAEKLALIHSEVSEALEDHRSNDMQESTTPEGKPTGFPTELADIVIRTLDLAQYLGIDLQASILRKMKYNESRPYKHGKAY